MINRLNFKNWYTKEIWHGIFNFTADYPVDLDKIKESDKNAVHMAWCYQQKRINELEQGIMGIIVFAEMMIKTETEHYELVVETMLESMKKLGLYEDKDND